MLDTLFESGPSDTILNSVNGLNYFQNQGNNYRFNPTSGSIELWNSDTNQWGNFNGNVSIGKEGGFLVTDANNKPIFESPSPSGWTNNIDWLGAGSAIFNGAMSVLNYFNSKRQLDLQEDMFNKQWNATVNNYNNNLLMQKQRNIDMGRAKAKFETGNASSYDDRINSVNNQLKGL